MAKATKSDSSPSTASASKPKTPAKTAGKPAGSSPLINTDFAAQSAARMLMNRAANTPISTTPRPKESSTFKQMKDSLAKPHLASMDSMLNSTSTANSQSSQTHRTNQKGHSQTYN